MGESAPVDHEVLDDIKSRLAKSDFFTGIEAEPEDNPDSLICYINTGYYPAGIEEVYLKIVWRENDDFSMHYRELYRNGDAWECRWDRHPNDHNDRSHYHPGPDPTTVEATDTSHPHDWRDVLTQVLDEIQTRVEEFWD